MSQDRDVDALRAKLKALGYLDAGVDRFVLAPAREGRSLWQIALRASVRIGVLAGLLLGVSGGVAAAARLPGLVTGVRDSVVLAGMLGLAFGLATFLATFFAIWMTARLLRALGPRHGVANRARPLAMGAGALVGAASLAYLTLWWGATTGDAVARATAATGVAVVVAVVISVLLGHSTSTIIQAMLAADAGSTTAPRRRLSLRASVAIALVGAGASAGLLALRAPTHATDAPPPLLAVRPTGLRLVVVAIDGGDQALFDSVQRRHPDLLATHPWLAPLCTLAAESTDPAREWVTIATGQPVERHGVTALEVRRLAGLGGQLTATPGSRLAATLAAGADLLRLTRPAVNTGIVRREKTFWEVAAQAGLRTAALNWWTSWPALPEDGTVLSERAVLRLERGGALSAEIAPPTRYEALREQWPAIASRATQMVDQVVADEAGAPPPTAEIARALREAATVDAQQLALLETLADEPLDLATVYLPGLDILAARLREMSRDGATSALLVGAGDALVRYLHWLAANLATILEPRRPGVEPIVLAHPGRVGAPVAGPGPGDTAAAATPSAACTVYDITPTVLRALGVPLSTELPGAVLPDALPRLLGRSPRNPGTALQTPLPVPTYGRRGVGRARSGDGTLDEEMRERLRSLGYVQ